MKLYEINQEIERLLNRLEPDPETGEVAGVEEIAEQLSNLEGERAQKLENCAKAYFEAKRVAEQAKAEKQRLADRQAQAERKAQGILDFLTFVTNGEKTDCGIATFSVPKPRASLKTTDATEAALWLTHNGYFDYFVTQPPKLDAKQVKELLQRGKEIPGVELEYNAKAVLK